MKKSSIIIIGIIVVLIGLLLPFKDLKIDIFKKNDITLEQIKENLVNTKEIYICKNYEGLVFKCQGDKLEKIIDDEKIIKEFIDTTISLPEYKGDVTTVHIGTTLCFVDAKGKVIATAGFSESYILRTEENEYYLDFHEEMNHLRDLLGLKRIDVD